MFTRRLRASEATGLMFKIKNLGLQLGLQNLGQESLNIIVDIIAPGVTGP